MENEKMKVTWDDINNDSNSKIVVDVPTGDSVSNTAPQTVEKPSNCTKNKWIFIIPVFIITILIAVGTVYYFSVYRYQRPIERVLKQDKAISTDIPNGSAVEKASSAVKRMHTVDLSGCPEDFQSAYKQFIKACEKLIPILKEAEEMNSWEKVIENFFIGLFGGATGQYGLVIDQVMGDISACDELQQNAQSVLAEISRTHKEVLEVAKKYQVDITPYNDQK